VGGEQGGYVEKKRRLSREDRGKVLYKSGKTEGRIFKTVLHQHHLIFSKLL
jgi:hypothetical protein